MKKLITLIVALSALASLSTAAPFRGGSYGGLEKQLERIDAVLGKTDSDLSERKRAFLANRQEMLTLQLEVRDAMRDALADHENLSREEIEAAREEVRNQYRERFETFKEERRTERRERMGPRGTAES